MSSAPTNPPGDYPPIPAYWRDENDWIVLLIFLPRDDAGDRTRTAEAIGYMLAYAQMTDTRMLALLGDPNADAYELLFSFNSSENKAQFIDLLMSNDETHCEDFEIMIPPQEEIDAAQPIAKVLPGEVFQQVALTATMLLSEHSGTGTVQ